MSYFSRIIITKYFYVCYLTKLLNTEAQQIMRLILQMKNLDAYVKWIDQQHAAKSQLYKNLSLQPSGLVEKKSKTLKLLF